MVSRRKRKSNLHIYVVLFVVAVLLTVAVLTELKPNKEQADLKQYFASEAGSLAVVTNDILTHEDALVNGTTPYVSVSYLETLNPRFYFDETEKLLLLTLPDGTVKAEESTKLNDKRVLLQNRDGYYVLLEYAAQYTNLRWKLCQNPDRLVIRTEFGTRPVLQATEALAVREKASVSSPIMKTLALGETVTVKEEHTDWLYVCTEDGIPGYVEAGGGYARNTVTDKPVFAEPVYQMVSTRQGLCVAWHQIRYRDVDNDKLEELMATATGVNVVSPTWFHLMDGNGNFDSNAKADYVGRAHALGLDVWILVNNMDNEIYGDTLTTLFAQTSKRTALVDNLIRETVALGADGINVDIESLPTAAGRGFIQFIRELSLACHERGLVLSVDNYVPSSWTAHYDRKEQGVFADYVIVMGYDEHYAGSDAGSSASLGFVVDGAVKTLESVPAEKVIMGVPFFTRLWKGSGENLTSSLLNMAAAKEYQLQYGLTPIWDGTLGQNTVEFTMEGAKARIWIEDAESMEARLEALKEYRLAGLAAWRLGMETADVWPIITGYLENTTGTAD